MVPLVYALAPTALVGGYMNSLCMAVVVCALVLALVHSGWWLILAAAALLLAVATTPVLCPNCGQRCYFRQTKQGVKCTGCGTVLD